MMAKDKTAQGVSDAGVDEQTPDEEKSDESISNTSGVSELTYEQAREELIDIVAKIESGTVPLEESMVLWERGEALAAHCQSKLDAAQAQLDSSTPVDDDS